MDISSISVDHTFGNCTGYKSVYAQSSAGDVKSLELLIKETENPEIKKLLEFHLKNLEIQDSIMDQILQINQIVPHVPFLMVREYLDFCEGSTENALNMILNNIPIHGSHSSNEFGSGFDELAEVETKYLSSKSRLETYRSRSITLKKKVEDSMKDEDEEEEEEDGEKTDQRDSWVKNEKSLIETAIVEEEKRRNSQFFCRNEERIRRGKKAQVYTIQRSNEFYGTGEDFHFRFAESQFNRWIGRYGNQSQQWEITKIDYVVNPEVIMQFDKCKKELAKKHSFLESSMKPTMLFHGTSKEAMDAILKTNFIKMKIGSNTGNKGYYGCGFYFSEYPQYSIPYNRGCNQLLVCLGLTGRAHKMTYQIGAPRKEGYDSHVSDNGYEVVIYESEQVRPLYVIFLQPKSK